MVSYTYCNSILLADHRSAQIFALVCTNASFVTVKLLHGNSSKFVLQSNKMEMANTTPTETKTVSIINNLRNSRTAGHSLPIIEGDPVVEGSMDMAEATNGENREFSTNALNIRTLTYIDDSRPRHLYPTGGWFYLLSYCAQHSYDRVSHGCPPPHPPTFTFDCVPIYLIHESKCDVAGYEPRQEGHMPGFE